VEENGRGSGKRKSFEVEQFDVIANVNFHGGLDESNQAGALAASE